jgi:tRNA(His) 5'-end guanylyltransferase
VEVQEEQINLEVEEQVVKNFFSWRYKIISSWRNFLSSNGWRRWSSYVNKRSFWY